MQNDAQSVAERVSHLFGLPLDGFIRRRDGSDFLDLRPTGVEANEGFKLRLEIGWRSLEASFLLEPFSGPLLKAMANADSGRRRILSTLATEIAQSGTDVTLSINGSVVSPLKPESWPEAWSDFSLSLRRSPLDWSTLATSRVSEMAKWAGSLLSMILPLLPVVDESDTPENSRELAGLPEGARMRVEVNRYERSRLNRAICIQLNGTTCSICGTDMGEIYGEVGRDYIHVHHLVPLAAMKAEYRVDPTHDLIPICPNCHSMVHRRSPPIPPEELSEMIRKRKSIRVVD